MSNIRSHLNRLELVFWVWIYWWRFDLNMNKKILLSGSSKVTYLFYCSLETVVSFGILFGVGVVVLTYLLLLTSFGRLSSLLIFSLASVLFPIKLFDLFTLLSLFLLIAYLLLMNLDCSLSYGIMN